MIPYSDAKKVHGPYLRKDGRQHVVVVYPDLTKKTVSYPKYLVEIDIGRYLEGDEQVHHINGDFTDNSQENLKVVKWCNHMGHHAKYTTTVSTICYECKKEVNLTPTQQRTLNANLKRGRVGPFCSRQCRGIYGARKQYEH